MNTAVLDQKQVYHEVNSVTGCVNSVIFGTESLAELPVAELVQDFGLNISVCNRSVEEAVLADAFELLEECVFELNPRKVFLNFGETDLRREDFRLDAFIAEYRRLIEAVRKGSSSRIIVVSVLSDEKGARELNEALHSLCSECGVFFMDASHALLHEKPHLRLFNELMHHMREGRISFSEAMNLCEA